MNKYFSIIALITLVFFQQVKAAQADVPPRLFRLDGVITENTAQQFSRQISGWTNQDPIPAGLIVLLNSPGGDGEAAMKIGRLLRAKKAQVFVIGQCESACVFVMAGGVVRAANSGTVGIHAGRLTMTDKNGKILNEVDSSQSLTNSFRLTSFNSDAHKYFSEMGFSSGFLDAMLSHKTDQTYKLSEPEMREYSVTGFENSYLQERSKIFESLKGQTQINRVTLFNRTLSIPELCKGKATNNASFINCYKSVLYGFNPS